ncbi:hypothetical protein ACMA1I_19280 [Pontibacter sp. 13R65]|uniref:hypothetical protein n=1 Tax=Pontibacter sp. 13R65 TaxID=3127458 RepID=UPI00301D86F7
MHIEKYLSHTFQKSRASSPYQLILDKEENAYAEDNNSIREELISKYASFLGSTEFDFEKKYAFLSYHEAAFKGQSAFYLNFIKWTYKELWHENLDPVTLEWFRRKIKPVAKGWLESKKIDFNIAGGLQKLDERITVMDARGNPIPVAYIQFWFEDELLFEDKNKDQNMDPYDFDLFMRSWFSGTGEMAVIPGDKLLKTIVSGEYLKDMIKRFFQKYGKHTHNKGLRDRMINLMPVTFEKLKNSRLDVLRKTL